MSNNDYTERERQVLELYNEDKTTREIAKELRMSLRDIGFILKKGQVNHGITATTTATITNHPMKKLLRLTNSLLKEKSL
jgi:DNA-binding NarL/FixJ family response regulator